MQTDQSATCTYAAETNKDAETAEFDTRSDDIRRTYVHLSSLISLGTGELGKLMRTEGFAKQH